MKICLNTQGFDLTPAIDAHVKKQLHQHLHSSHDYITAVDVFLGDINGPKGGIDKRAMICVQLASRLSIRVETVHPDLYAAIAVAARKTQRSVKRTVRRNKRLARAQLRELRRYPADPSR